MATTSSIPLVLLFFVRSCALDEGALFARLASAHGVTTRLALRQPADGGPRGLVLDDAGPAVGVGEPLLAVPLELCLIEKRDPPSASPALPWEARLALKLLDALDGRDNGDGDVNVWPEYAPLLPRVGALANPQLLPDALLDRLGDATAADAAREQRAQIRSLFAGADADEEHDARRQWAWALVRSRTLAMRRGGGSTFDSFALVPFVDMANHGDGAGFGIHAARAARFAWPPSPNTDFRVERGLTPRVVLRALAPLAPGDEVLLRYGDELSARHAFAHYGFARAAAMAHEVFRTHILSLSFYSAIPRLFARANVCARARARALSLSACCVRVCVCVCVHQIFVRSSRSKAPGSRALASTRRSPRSLPPRPTTMTVLRRARTRPRARTRARERSRARCAPHAAATPTRRETTPARRRARERRS